MSTARHRRSGSGCMHRASSSPTTGPRLRSATTRSPATRPRSATARPSRRPTRRSTGLASPRGESASAGGCIARRNWPRHRFAAAGRCDAARGSSESRSGQSNPPFAPAPAAARSPRSPSRYPRTPPRPAHRTDRSRSPMYRTGPGAGAGGSHPCQAATVHWPWYRRRSRVPGPPESGCLPCGSPIRRDRSAARAPARDHRAPAPAPRRRPERPR